MQQQRLNDPKLAFRLTLALAVALGNVAGCQPQDRRHTGSADSSSMTAAQPTVITLTATDYAFETPDTLAAGWTTFRLVNRGGQPHMGQLIRLEPGMTVADYLKAYGEAFRTRGPRPEWARRLGGPGVATPQQTTNATLYLEPGNYVWICLYNLPDGIPHVVGHGMAEPFVVRAGGESPVPGNAPKADVVMRLLDFSFSLSTPLTAGHHLIRVENAGLESHEVAVVKLAAGKTIKDVYAWLQNPGAEPPENLASVAGGVTSLAPGAEAWFEIDLPPGEYVLLCFVTARDGRSHIEHGMIEQVVIS